MVNGIDKHYAKAIMRKSKVVKEKKIGRKIWRQGDLVICRTTSNAFEAVIDRFYENSAIVTDDLFRSRCVSLRNMIDPITNKALKKTNKKEAYSTSNVRLTAYIATLQELEEWGQNVEVTK